MDLGSTNGTWVNRARITPFKEVPLYPGDVVCFAEPNIAFQVQAVPCINSSNDTSNTCNTAVAAALQVASALESEAASRGVFAPAIDSSVVVTDPAAIGDTVRRLATDGNYQAAYMLLLGSVMANPSSASLWAQLAGMERQRARRREQGSSPGTVRMFFRAAVERFEAMTDTSSGTTVKRRREGLARVFSSWAQLEYDMRNDGPARILFQKAVRAARGHPEGAVVGGVAKVLFTWASREWKLGDAPLAARLCKEALEVEPNNAFVLTLLGNIEAAAAGGSGGAAGAAEGVAAAQALFRHAMAADKNYVPALQSWARLEAQCGNIDAARALFRRALALQPNNSFVLQAWGVAEGRAGCVDAARVLFRECTDIDPRCRAAWHAWGKLEEAQCVLDFDDDKDGVVATSTCTATAKELYNKALALKKNSVETLNALGRLERIDGNLKEARELIDRALAEDPRHAPSLNELALILRRGGAAAEAYRLEKRAKGVNQERRAMLAQMKHEDANGGGGRGPGVEVGSNK